MNNAAFSVGEWVERKTDGAVGVVKKIQPYDEPGYFDTSIPGQEHRLCDHENGECDVEEYDEEEEYA